ncbi:hypothetical protein [Meridianimarinicoccus aquatilis]|uniref:Acyl carrier protein n=1 Tax=Meridianimarinicoccus aquatilis TaxID=2552766 RepID=A0A4R6AWB6_9RHOB|nr:hypothetical protein [Fluviibacterium aquatile]QIE43320.1 hypothetical protein G5B39_14870 [Rhodobacteraceae bacterium SC52]TDL86313.1 hypothetical protein E2L05_13630 [Fluviibacterium aquatile]
MSSIATITTSIAKVRSDLDPEWLEPDTRMRADLGLTSIDLLNVLALVTQSIGKKIMYEPLLLPEGKPRAELTIGELAAFVDDNLDAAEPDVVAM